MLDIIIPAYLPTEKYVYFLNRALYSLEKQTYKEFNTIIVFNGLYTNKDIIIKNIKYNKNVSFYFLDGKQSAAKARNFAVKQSNAYYIAQLDADDQFHKDKIKKQIDYLEQNKNIDFLGTLAYDYYSENQIIDSCFAPHQYETNEQISKIILKENVMCNGSVMFKRESFNKLNGYNEQYKPGAYWPDYNRNMWEDWDLYIRAIKNNMIIHNLPERLYYWSANTGVER